MLLRSLMSIRTSYPPLFRLHYPAWSSRATSVMNAPELPAFYGATFRD